MVVCRSVALWACNVGLDGPGESPRQHPVGGITTTLLMSLLFVGGVIFELQPTAQGLWVKTHSKCWTIDDRAFGVVSF